MSKRTLGFLAGIVALALIAWLLWHNEPAPSAARASTPQVEAATPSSPPLPGETDPPRDLAPAEPTIEPATALAASDTPIEAEQPSFFGRILDEDSSAPISAAEIRFIVRGSEAAPPGARSDERGRFQLACDPSVRRFARATAAGYSEAVFAVDREHASEERAFELRVPRSASVDVRVSDAKGPVSDLSIVFTTESYRLQKSSTSLDFYDAGDPAWRGTTDASGRALIEVPSRVALHASVRRAHLPARNEPEPLTLAPGEVRELAIVLGSGCVVRGHLQDRAGAPIPHHPIWRVPAERAVARAFQRYETPAATVVTDDDGAFAFTDVPAGSWNVGPSPETDPRRQKRDKAPFAGLAELVEIAPGESERSIVLVVDRELYLRGRVIDPGGQPATKSHVYASRTDGVWAYDNAIMVGADASFEIGPLSQGEWEVIAAPMPGERLAQAEPFRTPAGVDGIVLQLRRAGSIRGRVIDARTGEKRVAQVIAGPAQEDSSSGTWSGSAKDGVFEFANLLPGRYALAASTDDGLAGRSDVEVRTDVVSEVTIEVSPGAKLVLHYTGKARVASFTVRADGQRVATDGVDSGSSYTAVVPAGELQVTWTEFDTKFEETLPLTLAVGEERELRWSGKP